MGLGSSEGVEDLGEGKFDFAGGEMTIDDDNSIYVGGLPYNATEDSIRKVFNLYGAIVAVKIINERGVGGKCYGFVTFTNPRSAIDAINDMNGRDIDGRIVVVNEVRTRGGRSNFGRESFRRNSERGMDWDRGRDRERDYGHDKDHFRDRNIDRSRDHDRERERGHERARDHDRTRDRFMDRNRDQDRDMEDNEQEHSRNHDQDWERDRDMDWDQDREMNNTNDHDKSGDKDEHSKKRNGGRHSRGLSSDSDGDYHDQVEEVDRSIQRREELQKEISQMEERLEEKQQLVLDLQKKSLKLEGALTAAKKLSSQRQLQLTKLHRCFLQVKENTERLKSCEQELQTVLGAAMMEIDIVDDVGLRDGILENGRT